MIREGGREAGGANGFWGVGGTCQSRVTQSPPSICCSKGLKAAEPYTLQRSLTEQCEKGTGPGVILS